MAVTQGRSHRAAIRARLNRLIRILLTTIIKTITLRHNQVSHPRPASAMVTKTKDKYLTVYKLLSNSINIAGKLQLPQLNLSCMSRQNNKRKCEDLWKWWIQQMFSNDMTYQMNKVWHQLRSISGSLLASAKVEPNKKSNKSLKLSRNNFNSTNSTS